MELPRCIQEIAGVIGRERALYLIGQLPRIRIESKQWSKAILYVPKRLKVDDTLVRILGWNDATKMVNTFGGEMLHPGNCDYVYRAFLHRSINRMFTEGMSVKAIAELLELSERTVKRHCDDKPQQENQPANDNTPQITSHRATA